MINPQLLASVPRPIFRDGVIVRNLTPFQDLIGVLWRYHGALTAQIARTTGTSPARVPLDAEAALPDLLHAIQQQHQAEALALGVAPPPDLESFTLSEAAEWASWTFHMSRDLARLRTAAGLS